MNPSAVMDVVNEIEETTPVDQWIVDGIRVWPLLRCNLWFSLCMENGSNPHRTGWPGRVHRMGQWGGSTLKGWASYTRARVADRAQSQAPARVDAVFLSDGVSYSSVNGAWYERFCEPLMDRLRDLRFSSLLLTPMHLYHTPRHAPSMWIQPHLDIISLSGILTNRKGGASDAILPGLNECNSRLAARGLARLGSDPSALQWRVRRIRRYADFFGTILDVAQPSVVFMVSYYWSGGMAMSLACRGRGIPTIDLQHGVQGALHGAYGRWRRIPRTGYELLPQIFWCWSEVEAKAIQEWNATVADHHRPVLGGNPWLSEWMKEGTDLVVPHDRRIRSLMGAKAKRHILVTLQSGFTHQGVLADLLQAMRDSPDDWQWWVRLHPVDVDKRSHVRGLLERSKVRNFTLEASTDLPLYALLRQMDVHVTHSSSTVLEAETFSVPSVLVSQYGVERYPEQIRSGWAVSASSSHQILAAVEEQLEKRNSLSATRAVDSFSSPAFRAVLNLLGKRREVSTDHPGDSVDTTAKPRGQHVFLN